MDREKQSPERLTARETQVATDIARGATPRETAARLRISAKTVSTHRENALRKLGLRTNADLTRWALFFNLVTFDGHVVDQGHSP